MKDLIQPTPMEQFELNCRHAWHYMIETSIGDLHIVQHEVQREMNIVDDYMGWSNTKAEQAFKAIASKMLKGKA